MSGGGGEGEGRGHVAALVRSYLNGLKPFERTMKRTTETMPLAPKQEQLLQ